MKKKSREGGKQEALNITQHKLAVNYRAKVIIWIIYNERAAVLNLINVLQEKRQF